MSGGELLQREWAPPRETEAFELDLGDFFASVEDDAALP
jgi:hypothetical protein